MNGKALQRLRYITLAGTVACAAAAVAQNQPAMPDAQIEANVLRALASAPELSTQNIQTSTVYGAVTLTGNVHDEAMRTTAENLVARASGVKKVVDELALGDTPPPSQQADAQADTQAGAPPAPDQQQPPDSSQPQPDGGYSISQPPPPQGQPGQQTSPDGTQYPGGYGPPQDDAQQGQPPNAQPPNGYGPPQQGQYPDQSQPPNGYGPPQGAQPGQYPQQGQPPNGQYPGGYGPPQDATQQGQYPPDQGQYPAQQPYGPPQRRPLYQGQQPGYAPPPGGQQAGLAVTIPANSMLRIRINRGIDSNHIQPGTPFDGTVLNDVAADGAIAIPRGAAVQGTVVSSKKAGALNGQGELSLQINSVTLGGVTYPLDTELWQREGRDKTGRTVNNAIGLGALGAIFGGIAGGGAGAAIGAAAGAGVGVAGSAASPGGRVIIPPEAVITFQLAQPALVRTVSEQEMSRLAESAGPAQQPQPRMRRYYSPYYGYYYAPY